MVAGGWLEVGEGGSLTCLPPCHFFPWNMKAFNNFLSGFAWLGNALRASTWILLTLSLFFFWLISKLVFISALGFGWPMWYSCCVNQSSWGVAWRVFSWYPSEYQVWWGWNRLSITKIWPLCTHCVRIPSLTSPNFFGEFLRSISDWLHFQIPTSYSYQIV